MTATHVYGKTFVGTLQAQWYTKSELQTSIFRLEKRKDIRISTLIEYLDNLGMGLEIKTFPKDDVKKIKD